MSQTVEGQLEALRQELAETKQRVGELEAQLEQTETGGRTAGWRDEAVRNRLSHGELTSLGKLEALYRAETDVRNKRKLRDRIKGLTQSDDFEMVAHGTWRYVGGEGE